MVKRENCLTLIALVFLFGFVVVIIVLSLYSLKKFMLTAQRQMGETIASETARGSKIPLVRTCQCSESPRRHDLARQGGVWKWYSRGTEC